MKISIVTGPSYPVPPIEGGAIPRIWQGLAEEFARAGHSVELFARSHPDQPATENIGGVTYFRSGGFAQSRVLARDLALDFKYALGVLLKLPKSDILITNDFWLPALARLRGEAIGRVVVNANRFPKGQYFLYRRVAMIAAASRAVQEAILSQTPAVAGKTRVIPNPLDTEVFTPGPRTRTKTDRWTALYVGRIHPEKGVHLLIDAFRLLCQRMRHGRLLLVGPAEERLGGGGQEYSRIISAKADGLDVRFLGPLFDTRALAEIYRSADIFCYPSLAETGESFGVAPLEAMASGLVPVVSSLDCFSDFIDEPGTGFFFDHRANNPAEALAAAIIRALSNRDRLNSMGVVATRKAQEFSFQKIATHYLESFTELLSEPRTRKVRCQAGLADRA
jgi:glycosyltransferase involved in cell wall biosynthesis